MPILPLHRRSLKGFLSVLALLALGAGLSGCAGMSDTIAPAFADPAKYDLYDCKQLETERKTLATRTAELQGLMNKAETGVAGPVVAELAYRNEYIALRGQSKLADEAWQKNRCVESKPEAPPTAAAPAGKAGRTKAKRAAN
ncbi:twin-arginine translocation pathway signal [Bradyrhizobium sp.]|uniref:twin-arginine translocation pathway signal n=1 Tax=Bradyrhizobium sp. TaxID=376 RepID=UPI002B89D7E1|nr:twin-arginine translocation pathway signal [Bradyrhizobium sp.]HMM90754.1 twin-arginine translocation pathway signal [Bradyrhizobium sp.]